MAKISGTAGKVVLGSNVTITGATGTTTITITGVTTQTAGDKILIEGVVGMTDINGEHLVTAVSAGVNLQIVLATATSQSFSGSSGTLKDCANITNWSLDIAGEVIKTTDSNVTTWDTYIANGFSGGSGTFDAFFITGATDIPLQTSTTLILRQDASNYYTCTAFITANTSTVDVPGSEAVKKTYSFTTTGTITPTVA